MVPTAKSTSTISGIAAGWNQPDFLLKHAIDFCEFS
jgi:hypothetical protein